jgi:hypothetical protein
MPASRLIGNVTLTTTTASTVLAAPGAGFHIVVTMVKATNASGTIATIVEIRDGLVVKMRDYCPELGGGYVMGLGGATPSQMPLGLFAGTSNTAITARCTVTGASVDVCICGYVEAD